MLTAEEQDVEADRAAYRARFPVCPWTGRRYRVTIHELIGGRFRQRTYCDPRFWLPCDYWFHTTVIQFEPLAKGFARKLWLDDGHFDLAALHELPGFQVDYSDVQEQLDLLCHELGKRSYRA